MAKPIRALELHYPMIQFEIIRIIRYGEWVIWLDTKTSFRHLDLKALNIWILSSKSNNRQSAVALLSIYYFCIHSTTYVFTRYLNSNPIHSRGILWNKDFTFSLNKRSKYILALLIKKYKQLSWILANHSPQLILNGVVCPQYSFNSVQRVKN